MPRTELMSWDRRNRQWQKRHHGVRYRVTCTQLGAEPTRLGSFRAANQWWKATLSELNRVDPLLERLGSLRSGDLSKRVQSLQRELDAALTLLYAKTGATERQPPQLGSKHGFFVTVPSEDGNFNRSGVSELLNRVEGATVETDRTLAYHLERFLKVERDKGKAVATYAHLSRMLKRLIAHCPELSADTEVGKLDAATLTAVYSWLRSESGWAASSQLGAFQYFKRLIQFLYEHELCERPRNFDSRQFVFDAGAKKIVLPTVEEVRALLVDLPERLYLYALLALNAGMLGVDMAFLRHEELQGGRIVRKRTKTRYRSDQVPEVNYLLWKETEDAVNKWRSNHPEYVLTSSVGTLLYREEVKTDGSIGKTNLILSQWQDRRLPITLKSLRAFSANLLEQHDKHYRFASLFLGHAPKSIKDKHYTNYSQAGFDKAVMWLREQVL